MKLCYSVTPRQPRLFDISSPGTQRDAALPLPPRSQPGSGAAGSGWAHSLHHDSLNLETDFFFSPQSRVIESFCRKQTNTLVVWKSSRFTEDHFFSLNISYTG